MWSHFLLCLLVGFAAASSYGWKSNTEYMYKIRGRTVTGLHDVAHQYSGIVMKANLIVRTKTDGKLMATISDAYYSQIHAHLPEGWKSDIPESELHYKPLKISDKPFEIIEKDGIIEDIVVEKEVHNWEANMIKSIVSQIQLDTQGHKSIKSHITQLPEEDSNSATFKTFEETITGKYETLYDISPLPEYLLQSQPWLAPLPEMKGDGEFIEIVKTKNFSRSEERIGYHYGFGNNNEWEPGTNNMGDFFIRTSVSRCVISGTLKHYTIQSCTTANKIVVSPTLNTDDKGMVVSFLNITLSHVQPASIKFSDIKDRTHLGSLTYSFNTPFSTSNEARWKKQESTENRDESSEESQYHADRRLRHRRTITSDESVDSKDYWTQELPKLHEAPQTPLLPMFVGYKGKSVKTSENVDIVSLVKKICEQIGKEIKNPDKIPKERTLTKFTILVRLTRTMTEKEMKHVASELYTKEHDGYKSIAWTIFRDAVAEAGTGPALLTMQDWIVTKKIRTEEAAEAIATLAQSVRVPTKEFIRYFYALSMKDEVKSQEIVNDTAILSFTSFIRKVCVNKEYSHNQYPVHSFGKFITDKECEEIVTQEVIPYLKEKLHDAVAKADSHKILVYIRALGNVAHKKILAVFEPYLEGDKQMSQFQRAQIVLSFDKLTKIHPKVIGSVLYKIYQNAGESQEIRVLAVYQLMRCFPTSAMLQRMAEYTHVDQDEQVNAAVKSVIEDYAELEGDEYSDIAESARSAMPLLTEKTYGKQYSQSYIKSYVVDEMNFLYKQNAFYIGSEDSLFPRLIKYNIKTFLGGVQSELINIQGMISSIDELTKVFEKQTEKYQQKQKQHKKYYEEATQSKYSSESIARTLKMETDEREQLEGSFLFQIGGGATRFFTFNNRTVEFLPEVIRQLEEEWHDGESFNYTKIINRDDIDVAFPTEMAIPFVYTLDVPTLIHIHGEVKASAEPKICSGNVIHKPRTIKARGEISALISTKMQAKIGFVTPFDHHEYISGYDKDIQVHIPIKAEVEIDIKEKEVTAQIEPLKPEEKARIFYYKTRAYTAAKDILSFEPASKLGRKIKSVDCNRRMKFETTIGKKSGMAFHVNYTSEQQVMDYQWFYEQIQRHDFVSAVLAPYYDETIMNTKFDVVYAGDISHVKKLKFRVSYDRKYKNEDDDGNESDTDFNAKSIYELPKESKARYQKIYKMVSSGIRNADVTVVEASMEYNDIEYKTSVGVACSHVDDKSRVLFHLKKYCKRDEDRFEVAAATKARFPNTNALDFKYALKFDPTSIIKTDISFGKDAESATTVRAQATFSQSEARKWYLKDHPRTEECRREMEKGNKHLSACANITAEANLMDRIHIKLRFENMGSKMRNVTFKCYDFLHYLAYYHSDVNVLDSKFDDKDTETDIKIKFEPDFEYVNVSLDSSKIQSDFTMIRVNNWFKQIFAVHPVFPVHTRVASEILELDTYRPICVADKTKINTFDNKTYSIGWENAWTVMLQYVPDFARTKSHRQSYIEHQEEDQIEHYVVLVRGYKNDDSEKEVRMTIRTPETESKSIEVHMEPSELGHKSASGSSPAAKVTVNKKEYKFDDKKSTDIEDGFIKIYALPNGETKVEVRDCFYIIYDGETVKIAVIHQKFRDAVRGLCGTFDGNEYTDFLTPKNCYLKDPREFAATYAIEEEGRIPEFKTRADKSECYTNDIIYANVVSDYDTGRREHKSKLSNAHSKTSQYDSCTIHQTRYVEDNSGRVCFTIRPIPVCNRNCITSNTIRKQMAVHCVPRTNISELWMKQIDKGASPDFSSKDATKTEKFEVPESCSRY